MKSCIIAGEGNLPILLAEKNIDFIVIAIKNLAFSNSFKNTTYIVDMLDLNGIIKILKCHSIKNLIFAGKFYRQQNNKKISKEVKKILDETKFLGDDSTLKKIKNIFEKNGFKVVSPNSLIRHNFKANEIIYNKKLHNKEDLKYFRNTIKIGKDILDLISKFDIGQSIVARKDHILGIEGIEGTNELIKRCGKYFNKQLNEDNEFGPVLIKAPKLNQTLDLDMPVIGLDTIKLAYKYNFFGIGFSQKGVLIVNEPEIRSFCENKNFYLYCIGDRD